MNNPGVRKKLFEVLSVLPRRDRKKLSLVVLVQSFLALFDLAGIALIGLIAGLAVNGVRSVSPGIRTTKVLNTLGINNFTLQQQTLVLALLAASLLVGKSLLSMYFSKKILYFLSQKSATISSKLVNQILAQHLIAVRGNSSPRLIYAATTGVTSLVVGVIGNLITIISDLSLCLVLGLSLVAFNPTVSLISLITFSLMLTLIYKRLNKKSIWVTQEQTRLNIGGTELLLEVIDTYREAVVRNRRGYYAATIGNSRREMAHLNAEQAWMPNISKYVVEISVTVGTLVLAGIQFSSQDAPHAIGGLALFFAAGTRLAPSLLRIQQNLIVMNSSFEAGKPTIELLAEFEFEKDIIFSSSDEINQQHQDFSASVNFHDVTFSYPGTENSGVFDINFTINPGEFVAIVGPSGAGKTTLVDLLLGIHSPISGEINISSTSPLDAISKWPGAVGYVPQEVNIVNGTVRSNLGLGFPLSEVQDNYCRDAISQAKLTNVVAKLQNGIDSSVGEKGSKLSGGERQRLGIARALITRPKLLILDEATSALDGETELALGEAISSMSDEVTVILIAHRLTTVKMATRLLYLENGRIIASGTFDEVRSAVPDFDRQAGISGL